MKIKPKTQEDWEKEVATICARYGQLLPLEAVERIKKEFQKFAKVIKLKKLRGWEHTNSREWERGYNDAVWKLNQKIKNYLKIYAKRAKKKKIEEKEKLLKKIEKKMKDLEPLLVRDGKITYTNDNAFISGKYQMLYQLKEEIEKGWL